MSPEAGAWFWSHAALVPVLLPCVSHLGGANAPREAAFALTTAALAEGEAQLPAGVRPAGGGGLQEWPGRQGSPACPPRSPGPRRVLRLRCCSNTHLLECVRFVGEGRRLSRTGKHVSLCPSPAWA